MTPQGRRNTLSLAFSMFSAGDYPRFDGLVALMRHGRLPHHRSAAVASELDFLSSELAKGLRAGGVVGATGCFVSAWPACACAAGTPSTAAFSGASPTRLRRDHRDRKFSGSLIRARLPKRVCAVLALPDRRGHVYA